MVERSRVIETVGTGQPAASEAAINFAVQKVWREHLLENVKQPSSIYIEDEKLTQEMIDGTLRGNLLKETRPGRRSVMVIVLTKAPPEGAMQKPPAVSVQASGEAPAKEPVSRIPSLNRRDRDNRRVKGFKRLTAAAAICAAFVAACGAATPDGAYPTGTSVPTASPTETFMPTSTPTPTPRPKPERTPALWMPPVWPSELPGEGPISAPGPLDPTATCNPATVPDALPVALLPKAPSTIEEQVPVIMIHHVNYVEVLNKDVYQASPSLVIKPETIDAQLKRLFEAGWHTVTAADLANAMVNNIKLPDGIFVITVDDGGADGLTYLEPILKKYGFDATYFIVTAQRGGLFLDATQIKTLAKDGNEIGVHTVHHVNLTVSNNKDHEIDDSAIDIANLTGIWPSTMAYPGGSFNIKAENAVERCEGMRMAFTTMEGIGNEKWSTRFEVKRIRDSESITPDQLLTKMTNHK